MREPMRWTLGILSAAVIVGWLALAIIGSSFRSSFGASPVELLTLAAPLVVPALVLASVLAPGNRILLHATAVTVAVSCICLAFLLAESAFIGTVGLAFCGAWFVFYNQSL